MGDSGGTGRGGGGTGPFVGLRVIDMTTGIAGAVATMLLGDAGAEVIRLDVPDDPFRRLSGYRVWHRGKRRASVQLDDAADRQMIAGLLEGADVLVETFEAAPAWLSPAALAQANPALVHCSITGYGEAAAHQGRPAIDSLVSARTGLCWELRGVAGTTIGRLSGREDPLGFLGDSPWPGVGPDREGPMHPGIPWASQATACLAAIGVAAALRARGISGQGRHIATSLLQGAICTSSIAWQRAEHVDAPGYLGWTTDVRAPKGFYVAADGKWFQQWVQLPQFMMHAGAAEVAPLRQSEVLRMGSSTTAGTAADAGQGFSPKQAELRLSTDYSDLILLQHFHPEMEQAAKRFTARQWEDLAQAASVPLEVVRSPEEALMDEAFLADGCVTEMVDAEHGTVRGVGRVVRLGNHDHRMAVATTAPGADDSWVRALPPRAPAATTSSAVPPGAPLAGVRVLDLGLAIAGPYGAQMLASLGADVIKVSSAQEGFWMGTQYAHMCNRGKRSVVIDLKAEDGLQVFYELVRSADVVHHNMRAAAAERLGIDYPSLQKVNPRLIYCHTRGYEESERNQKPANDQTGAALCGTEWVDGGTDDGGTPIWPSISLGDAGNGLLSALGVLQALYERDRTGKGQLVGTSIAYAHLLNASAAWVSGDGRVSGERPRLDAHCWGTSPLQRIYATADGWLCLSVQTELEWAALRAEIPALDDSAFETEPGRARSADLLTAALGGALAEDTAPRWAERLHGAGVPAEAVADGPGHVVFDDPQLKEVGIITAYTHPVMGRMEMAGRLIDTAGSRELGAAPLLGQHSAEILAEIGVDPGRLQELVAAGIVQG